MKTDQQHLQLLLQFGAWMVFFCSQWRRQWSILARPQLKRDFWILPVLDLAAALNVAPGEIMELKKAAYGLESGTSVFLQC